MSDIDISKIQQLDGALLLVLRELLRQRRTTLVARRLGLSQSAVSHALGRLRVLFGDPLFVRRPHGLEPTRHALDLAPRIDALLADMDAALGASDAFAPETSTRSFRISAPDHLALLIAPRLLGSFVQHAPRARFAFNQRLGRDALVALARDEIDLALGRFPNEHEGMLAAPLLEDHYCLIARRRHPRLKKTLTRALYAQLDHVQISVAGDFNSLTIETLGERAVTNKRPVAAVPRFLIACAVVGGSDAVAVAPRRMAEAYADRFDLTVHDLPFASQPLRVIALRRPHADHGVAWLLDRVKDAVGE